MQFEERSEASLQSVFARKHEDFVLVLNRELTALSPTEPSLGVSEYRTNDASRTEHSFYVILQRKEEHRSGRGAKEGESYVSISIDVTGGDG